MRLSPRTMRQLGWLWARGSGMLCLGAAGTRQGVMDVASLGGSEAMLMDLRANRVVNEEGIRFITNDVVKIASDGVSVNASSFGVITLGHLIG